MNPLVVLIVVAAGLALGLALGRALGALSSRGDRPHRDREAALASSNPIGDRYMNIAEQIELNNRARGLLQPPPRDILESFTPCTNLRDAMRLWDQCVREGFTMEVEHDRIGVYVEVYALPHYPPVMEHFHHAHERDVHVLARAITKATVSALGAKARGVQEQGRINRER